MNALVLKNKRSVIYFLCVVLIKGGSFNSGQAYQGTMSRVNVWNFKLADKIIKEMSKGCGLWSGNAFVWYNFKNNIFGNIQIISPSSCSLAGRCGILGGLQWSSPTTVKWPKTIRQPVFFTINRQMRKPISINH